MTVSDGTFHALILEAVAACGTDIPAIERYVGERVKTMAEGDRHAIEREIARVLGFREPDASPYKHN